MNEKTAAEDSNVSTQPDTAGELTALEPLTDEGRRAIARTLDSAIGDIRHSLFDVESKLDRLQGLVDDVVGRDARCDRCGHIFQSIEERFSHDFGEKEPWMLCGVCDLKETRHDR